MDAASTAPAHLGKYEVRGTLGRGAMGTVYDGWDPVIGRRVAIKTVPLLDQADPDAREGLARFKREAQAAGRLSHPNIVGVYDYGETMEAAFIVMEFVEGQSLKERLDAGERFGAAETVRILEQILAGMQFSHAAGVIHRDIKPGNVMITKDGRVKLADFGIARIESSTMTQDGSILGTPAYMSPEQLTAQSVDARSDIYAAGVVLYQLLAGERPFNGGIAAITHKVLNTVPPRPSDISVAAPPALDAVVARAMARRPADRFASADAFAHALDAAFQPPGAVPADDQRASDDATAVLTAPRPVAQPAGKAAPRPAAATRPPPASIPARRATAPLIGVAVAVLLAAAGGAWFALRPAPDGSGAGKPPAQVADAKPSTGTTPGREPPAASLSTQGTAPGSTATSATSGASDAGRATSGETSKPPSSTSTGSSGTGQTPPTTTTGAAPPTTTTGAAPPTTTTGAAPPTTTTGAAPPDAASTKSAEASPPTTGTSASASSGSSAAGSPSAGAAGSGPAAGSATGASDGGPTRLGPANSGTSSAEPAGRDAPGAGGHGAGSSGAAGSLATGVAGATPPVGSTAGAAAAGGTPASEAGQSATQSTQSHTAPTQSAALESRLPPQLQDNGLPHAVALPAPLTPAMLRDALLAVRRSAGCALPRFGVSDEGRVDVSGLVGIGPPEAALRTAAQAAAPGAPQAWHLTRVDGPYCVALDVIRPIDQPTSPFFGLALKDDATRLTDHEPIAPILRLPDFPAHLVVDYLSHDGSVTHLFPGPGAPDRVFAANTTLLLRDQLKANWEVGPPFGTDMIIAVAASAPLFAANRPDGEAAETYLPALQAAIDTTRRKNIRVTGQAIALETVAR